MLEYRVDARRRDAHGSLAYGKKAGIVLDPDVAGRPDAFVSPKRTAIDHELVVDIDGDDRRLDLLQLEVCEFGTISNTVAADTHIEDWILRASGKASSAAALFPARGRSV